MTCFSAVVTMLMLVGSACAVDRLEVIDLPVGFAPEGITIGHPWEAYVGSLVDGSIWMGNLKTGEGHVVIEGPGAGNMSVGLDFDKRTDYLYVSGGSSGTARIYDGDFELVSEIILGATDGTSFINDVAVTDNYAYFTDSFQSQFYAIALSSNGELRDGPATVGTTITYSGDFGYVEDFYVEDFGYVEDVVNGNGIVASDDGSMLIIANYILATLYLVDSTTGSSSAIDLGGVEIYGDGLLRRQNTLWVCQNGVGGTQPEAIYEVSLSADWTCGSVADRALTSELFDVPTTAARQYNGIYAVNSKFGTAVEDIPTTAYEIIRVDRDGGEVSCVS